MASHAALLQAGDAAGRALKKGYEIPTKRTETNMDFKDKVVIITGGAQGIGRCIAEEFEKLGATVA